MSLRDHYDRHILPHLIDIVMRASMATRERELLIPQAQGQVLEIGAGSGLNFPYYTNAVDKLFALEPHATLVEKAKKRARDLPFPVDFLSLNSESIPLPDASVDWVVCTWVLCSIAGVEDALVEMKRVLKPGGKFAFVEHGLAPDPALAKWQHRLTPYWTVCAGGCHLNRKPDVLIEQAGFTIAEIDRDYLDTPKFLTYHYKGVAHKPTNGQQ